MRFKPQRTDFCAIASGQEGGGPCPGTPLGTPLPGQEGGFLGGFLPKPGFPKTPQNWASPTRDPMSPKVGALKVWCLCSKSSGAVVTCRSRKTLGRGGFLGHPSLAAPHGTLGRKNRGIAHKCWLYIPLLTAPSGGWLGALVKLCKYAMGSPGKGKGDVLSRYLLQQSTHGASAS